MSIYSVRCLFLYKSVHSCLQIYGFWLYGNSKTTGPTVTSRTGFVSFFLVMTQIHGIPGFACFFVTQIFSLIVFTGWSHSQYQKA